MIFSSLLFIFRFMPFAFLVYYVTPNKLKNLILLLLSLLFYSWGEPKYIGLMLASIFIDYLAGLCIDTFRRYSFIKHLALTLSICFNMGMLFFFKYAGFFAGTINTLLGSHLKVLQLALPIGISFYTFQTLSYTIDVYRDKVPAEKNIINFATFVTLFPQLIAGPIVKYTDINKELKERQITLHQVQEGLSDFIIGLGKKILIANNVGLFWSDVTRLGFHRVSTPTSWMSLLAFAFQIYFDFSGYSTMAIGLGKMLGFTFPANFNFPYISKSITEFWRRWHISLRVWFKEYLYIPLGGNRKGAIRTYLNLLVVWLFTGLWHGANWNFIMWGLFFFVLLSIEKMGLLSFLTQHPLIARIYTLFFLLLGWAIFATSSLSELAELLHRLFVFNWGMDCYYYFNNYFVTFLVAGFCSTPLVNRLYKQFFTNKVADAILHFIILLFCIAYLVDASYNPFLYFRF